MRPLKITDKCYKFFHSEIEGAERAKSNVYVAGQTYSSESHLFFFRRDEAVSSLKSLLYFMDYGDSLAELVVDDELVKSAMESSPYHFAAPKITIANTYNCESAEIRDLVLDALMNCTDFTVVRFCDVVIKLIEMKAFDSALYVYETICAEKSMILSDDEHLQVMEMGRQPWCLLVPLEAVHQCKTMKEYIELMKSKVGIMDKPI